MTCSSWDVSLPSAETPIHDDRVAEQFVESVNSDTLRPGLLKQRVKLAVFSTIPVTSLILFAELFVWLFGLDRPSMQSPFLNPEFDLVNQVNDQLFFSLRPNLNCNLQGVTVVTNSQGLRSAEIRPRKARESRILSLGESTTFGAGVEGNHTYSSVLESVLQQRDDSRNYRVINAGVSACSLFKV